jgi:hypothetical protein
MPVVSPFDYAQGRLRRIQWTATVRKVPRLRSGRLRAHGVAGVLGEYDGNNNLLRKYIYGPGVDQASVANYPRSK